jgi:geranylgeranyl pyrophosphate synthase
MTTATLSRPRARAAYPDEATFLADVERELLRELTTSGGHKPRLDDIARPLVTARTAKRARARLAYLLGKAFVAPVRVAVDIAVAVELVHAASLLHDDVLDGATSRRGLPSANHLNGDVLAVLAGDLVLTAALKRLIWLGPDAIESAIDVIAEMSRAVAHEVAARGLTPMPVGDWRDMAEGKTGALFGVVARLLGGAVGASDDGRRYDRALRRLGVAFQVADDIGDFDEDAGETPFQDLQSGNPSVVTSLAFERSVALRDKLVSLSVRGTPVGMDELPMLVALTRDSGALAQAGRIASSEIAAARELLLQELYEPASPRHTPLTVIMAWADRLTRVAVESSSGDTGASSWDEQASAGVVAIDADVQRSSSTSRTEEREP